MTHPIENLMTKIRTLLVADADVLALFKGGANDIRYNVRESRHDVSALPKPFISIEESDDELVLENTATRLNHDIAILVDYYYDDVTDLTPLSEYDNLEKIEAVLYGSDLENTTYSNDKACLDVEDSGSIRLIEDGIAKRQYRLSFRYYRQK